MAVGLGAFTEGLQSGIKARRESDISKQYQRILAGRADVSDRDWEAREKLARSTWQEEHKGLPDPMQGYVPRARTQQQDPALLRFGKFLGGKIKGFFGGAGEEAAPEASFVSPEIQPAGRQASGATTYGIPGYADGGRVDPRLRGIPEDQQEEAMRQLRQSEETTAYLGTDEAMEPGVPARMFGDAAAGYRESRAGVEAGYEALRQAEGAAQTGGAVRQVLSGYAGQIGETGMGLAKDVLIDNPLVQGVGGFFGWEGDGGEQAAGISAQQDTSTDAPAQAAVTAIDAPDRSDQQIAQQAMSEGQQAAVENFDYQLLADQGVGPEELPSMNTRDWADHRSNVFEVMMNQGASVEEAYQNMDAATVDTQMKGMAREMDKAAMYLQSGQNQAAALALRQGYQYFPNGVDVKFGTAVDPKTGRPAIITMGYDEETGEPTGQPMLITVDRLNAMRENMTNPAAFRAWTKDGHDLQMKINELQSVEEHRRGTREISGYRAETERMAELASGLPGRGMKLTDRDRRDNIYRQRLEMEAVDDPRVQDSLSRAMSQYEQATGVDTTAAVDEVMEAYNTGDFEGVRELLDSLRR